VLTLQRLILRSGVLMSGGSLVYAGVVVGRDGFLEITKAIRAWVFAINPIYACQFHFHLIKERPKLGAGSTRKNKFKNSEDKVSPQATAKMDNDQEEIARVLRRAASNPAAPDSLKVYDSKSGLQVHDFINGFKSNHVVQFSELKKWAEERSVTFEKWDDMADVDDEYDLVGVGVYLRYKEIQDGVYLWDVWAHMVLQSGATVNLSDFQFSKTKAHVWRRRFKRYKDFIESGGVLMEYGSGACAVAPGRRGHMSDLRKTAAKRGEPVSSPGEFRRDLSEMFKLISEQFGGAVHLPSTSKSKKLL
jgi:hypothetical protein